MSFDKKSLNTKFDIIGVLECWSIGNLSLSITPALHHSKDSRILLFKIPII